MPLLNRRLHHPYIEQEESTPVEAPEIIDPVISNLDRSCDMPDPQISVRRSLVDGNQADHQSGSALPAMGFNPAAATVDFNAGFPDPTGFDFLDFGLMPEAWSNALTIPFIDDGVWPSDQNQ